MSASNGVFYIIQLMLVNLKIFKQIRMSSSSFGQPSHKWNQTNHWRPVAPIYTYVNTSNGVMCKLIYPMSYVYF